MTHDDRRRLHLPTIDASAPACGKVVGGLTDEEVDILGRLRALHEEAVAARAAVAAGTRDADEAGARIAELRGLRVDLAAAGDAAGHRRMVLLGHEEPDERDRR